MCPTGIESELHRALSALHAAFLFLENGHGENARWSLQIAAQRMKPLIETLLTGHQLAA